MTINTGTFIPPFEPDDAEDRYHNTKFDCILHHEERGCIHPKHTGAFENCRNCPLLKEPLIIEW